MLALLRVAPLLPSPALRSVAGAVPGRDGKAGSYRSNWKAQFAVTPLNQHRAARSPLASSMMHFYSGPPMHILSGVDTRVGFTDQRFEYELLRAQQGIKRQEQRSSIRHIEDLAAHAAMPVIEDDERFFQYTAA
jgi:hypothetical protein